MSCIGYGYGTQHVAVGYRKPSVEYIEWGVAKSVCHQLLIDNDPRLTGYVTDVSSSNYDYDDEYYELNREYELDLVKAISVNTHLRLLEVEFSLVQEHDDWRLVKEFFPWLVHNRSIEHLVLKNFEYSNARMALQLSTFIEHNHKLRCIEITGIGILDRNKESRCRGYQSLSSVLIPTISKKNRLERINLSDSNIEDDVLTELMDALRETPGLHNLLDLCMGGNEIGWEGCTALHNILTTSECSIQVLDLNRSVYLDDECMDILVDGLVQNNTIISLNVACLDAVTSTCWSNFSKKYLSKKAKNTDDNCSLKWLWIGKNHFKNACCSSLVNALVGIDSLQVLDLCETTITPTGWQHLTKRLTVPTCLISELYLDRCTGIGDREVAVIFSLLANSVPCLKVLSMVAITSITPNGWKTCFQALLESQYESNLSSIILNKNNINYEGASLLVDWIATRASNVTQLELGSLKTYYDIPAITENGWCKFADVLQPRSTSKLQSLRIGSNLSDEAATCLFNALAENISLVSLKMGFATNSSNRGCWSFLATVLCDTSSFESICNSNHTLGELDVYENLHLYKTLQWLHPPMANFLRMNKDKDKSEVLRKKLLRFHFRKVENVGNVFGQLETKLLPHAVAWIGRDRLGFAAMYALFRDMPWLCNDCRTYEPS